jgi:2-polyprenyl-3-methyl-5-hydroxy-6-metoxy-1,4-benzoquinol methylase
LTSDPRRNPSGKGSLQLFPHNELRYYLFGLRAGLQNLFVNGVRLGVKKTVGKITQPINAPSRFAEYCHFDSAIQSYLTSLPVNRGVKILDVASPKMLGLYLARTTEAELTLTDISELNVDEYRVMWRALQSRARGSAVFSLQDVRSLHFDAAVFDVVYSMSVLEHVEGESGDSTAMREMVRVLKPGGLLVVSVPFGRTYAEQHRVGFAGAARKTGDHETYFFQRIYDRATFERRILSQTSDLDGVALTTVTRRNLWISRGFAMLGENVRGALGFLNPLLSPLQSRTLAGVTDAFPVRYGPMHTAQDVYGDLILAARKR